MEILQILFSRKSRLKHKNDDLLYVLEVCRDGLCKRSIKTGFSFTR